jgi:hypothetical protein
MGRKPKLTDQQKEASHGAKPERPWSASPRSYNVSHSTINRL